MLDAQAARVAPVERTPLTEDDLDPAVVTIRVVAKVPRSVVPVVAPAREGSGLLAYVVLGVADARPEREELHHLARVVLVGRPLRVLVSGKPEEHRGIGGDREKQIVEAP